MFLRLLFLNSRSAVQQMRRGIALTHAKEESIMATNQVPRDDWKQFLDDLSKSHKGRPAKAQLIGQGIPDSPETESLPFQGATLEEKGSDAHAVRVMLGEKFTHEVPSVEQLWSRRPGDDGGEMVEIHGGDGQRLILNFDRH